MKRTILINLSIAKPKLGSRGWEMNSTEHFWTALSLSPTNFKSRSQSNALSFWLKQWWQCFSMWIMLSSQDIMGFTCLHLAAKLGHYDIVHHLLSKASKYINCQVKFLIYWLLMSCKQKVMCQCKSLQEFYSLCLCRMMGDGLLSPGPSSISTRKLSTCYCLEGLILTSETRSVHTTHCSL